jgi:DNA-binding HxlR family transcriptional regulator
VCNGLGTMEGMEPRFFADCQARIAVELISGRWPMVVLYALGDGPARPGELRKQIGGISQKVLTETLRRLEYNASSSAGGTPRPHPASSTR